VEEAVEQVEVIAEIPSAEIMQDLVGGWKKLDLRGTPAEVVQPMYLEFILQETIEIDEA
jgi:hypothetical protein